jgi:hypothetical protein
MTSPLDRCELHERILDSERESHSRVRVRSQVRGPIFGPIFGSVAIFLLFTALTQGAAEHKFRA